MLNQVQHDISGKWYVITKILILCLFLIISDSALGALKGGLEYQIPIDYAKLSEEELENKAGFYYGLALKTSSGNVNEDMTAALNLYKILATKNRDNPVYAIRLGYLYDIVGQDKYAKSYFYQAVGSNPEQPEAYFRFGEFFYRRELYKRALNMYKEAYKRGYNNHYDTLYKIGDIYAKLGDTEAALKYLKSANELNPNSELESKITRIDNANKINKEYYSNTRIRVKER